jgi:hypothetical protein
VHHLVETYGEARDVLGGLEVSESTRTARVDHALEVLGAVECLLLLEEEDIASYGNAANGLTVCTAKRSVRVGDTQWCTYCSGKGMPSLLVK